MQKKYVNLLRVAVAVVCVLLAFFIIRHPAVKTMDMADAQSLMNESHAYIVDARPVQLYMKSHIPGAIWYPDNAYYEVGAYMLREQTRPVWVYGENEEQAKTRALNLKGKAYGDITVIGSFADYNGPVDEVNPSSVWNSPLIALFLQNRYDDIYHYLDPKHNMVTPYTKKPASDEMGRSYQLALYHYVEEYRKNGKNPDASGGHVMAMYQLHEGTYEGLEGKPVQGNVADKLKDYYTVAFDSYVEQMEKLAREGMSYEYASSIPEDYKNVGLYVHYCNAVHDVYHAADVMNGRSKDSMMQQKLEKEMRLLKADMLNPNCPDWLQSQIKEQLVKLNKTHEQLLAFKKRLGQSTSGNKGNSSSGSKAHGFAGSEDEWEDYDDYMDDYEYWEHRDVDDMDDWEDDWDEDE